MSSSNIDTAFVTLLTENQIAPRVHVQSLMPGDSRAEYVARQANMTL